MQGSLPGTRPGIRRHVLDETQLGSFVSTFAILRKLGFCSANIGVTLCDRRSRVTAAAPRIDLLKGSFGNAITLVILKVLEDFSHNFESASNNPKIKSNFQALICTPQQLGPNTGQL
jgi:hypothetical protein